MLGGVLYSGFSTIGEVLETVSEVLHAQEDYILVMVMPLFINQAIAPNICSANIW